MNGSKHYGKISVNITQSRSEGGMSRESGCLPRLTQQVRQVCAEQQLSAQSAAQTLYFENHRKFSQIFSLIHVRVQEVFISKNKTPFVKRFRA